MFREGSIKTGGEYSVFFKSSLALPRDTVWFPQFGGVLGAAGY